jgi:DNA topoisomerase-1
MEETLDQIESAEVDATQLLSRFYDSFQKALEAASEGMLSIKGVGIQTDIKCPQCENMLHIKVGKNGHFLACSGYPECTYSRDYIRDEKGHIQPIEPSVEEATDKVCNKCGKPMVVKRGKYGEFLACSGYPECLNTQSLNSNGSGKKIGVTCPKNGCEGETVERRSKRGKIFYGCSRFPECDFATWDKPVNRECPLCEATYLVEKTTKKDGTFLACPEKGCEFKEKLS